MAIQQEEKEICFEAFVNGAKGFCHHADILLESADREIGLPTLFTCSTSKPPNWH
jgi:hypothetical protein